MIDHTQLSYEIVALVTILAIVALGMLAASDVLYRVRRALRRREPSPIANYRARMMRVMAEGMDKGGAV